jgi:hypothetical protein
MKTINGEYWIYDDGFVQYADGDIGDQSHESLAIQSVQGNIVSNTDDPYKYDRLEYIDWDQFIQDIGQEGEHEDEEENVLSWMRENGISDEEYAVASGMMDAREYGMKHLGWKRVQGNNVESWTLTPSDLKAIASGLYEICDQEGIPQEDFENPDYTFYVSVYSTGRSFELNLNQMRQGTTNTINQQTAKINTQAQAASNYVKDLEKQSPYDYYKNKPIGDWYIPFEEWFLQREMVGTGAVYDGTKPSEDWNWWGAPGSTGVSPKKGPIKPKKKRKKK